MTTLPHDLDAERSVLGASLLDQKVAAACLSLLAPKDFYDPRDQIIWQTIRDVVSSGFPVDELTVLHALRESRRLAEPGRTGVGKVDLEFYTSLTTIMIGSGVNADHYAGIVKETSQRRELIRYCQDGFKHAMEGTRRVEELRQSLCTHIASLQLKPLKSGYTYNEALGIIVNDYSTAFKGELRMSTYTTGFANLDSMIGGFVPGELTLLAARTSMGKSAFMLQLMRNQAAAGHVPLLFSLEMTINQLMDRLVSNESQVDNRLLRKNNGMSEEQYARVLRSVAVLSKEHGIIDDSSGLTVAEIKTRTAMQRADHQCDILFVDYLGLVRSDQRQDTREREVAMISKQLKDLAKELQIPVIALCQLNRGVEARQDKRPQLADLRDSGSLEHDADCVIMLYRDSYYNENAEDKNEVEVIVEKQRNGPCGTVRLRYVPEFNLFRSAN